MKSRRAIRVLLMVVSGLLLVSCDLNFFRGFERPPFVEEEVLYSDLAHLQDDEGYLDLSEFTMVLDTADGLTVNPLIVPFILRVNDMITYDTIDRFSTEGGDLRVLAANLEAVLESLLQAVGMDLFGTPEDSAYVEVRNFTDSVQGTFGADVPLPQIVEIREIIQHCAAAAAQIRLLSNGNAKAVVEESADILLRLFGAAGGSSQDEDPYMEDQPGPDPVLPKSARTWVVGPETYEHLAEAYKFIFNLDDGRQFVLAGIQDDGGYMTIQLLLAGDDGFIPIDDPSTVFVIPPFPSEPSDPDFMGSAEEEILASQITDTLTLGGLFRLADTFLQQTEQTTNLLEVLGYVFSILTEHLDGFSGLDLGSDDLNEMFTIIKDNFSSDEIDSMIRTFDELADTSRGFFSTMDLEEGGGVSGISDAYLEFDGSLNAVGLDMAIYTLMSLPVDYLFRVSDLDPVGFLRLDPFMDFLTADDAIVVSIDETYETIDGVQKDLMTIECNYVGDIVSPQIVDLYLSILRDEGFGIDDYLLALTDSVSISHAFVDLDLLEKTLTVLHLDASTSEFFDQAYAWFVAY